MVIVIATNPHGVVVNGIDSHPLHSEFFSLKIEEIYCHEHLSSRNFEET